MDIEKLTKSQIVLLTLLISFVTSIATGIVTVSLMDQAPPAIAQTVNRIIERTVEKVTPAGQTASTIVTQEKTVVIKEADLISQAVQRASPSVVRFYTTDKENPTFLGLGVVLDGKGVMAGDADMFGKGGEAIADLGGSRVHVTVSSQDAASGVAFLSSATTTLDGKPASWSPVVLAGGEPVLGASVVVLAGKTTSRVASGIVTTVDTSADKKVTIVETDIASDAILPGSPVLTIDGTLLGLSTGASRLSSPSGFVSTASFMKPADAPPSASSTPSKK